MQSRRVTSLIAQIEILAEEIVEVQRSMHAISQRRKELITQLAREVGASEAADLLGYKHRTAIYTHILDVDRSDIS